MAGEPKTIKCPICGKPYIFYPFFEGDQSVCPECSDEAKKWTPTWERRD